MRLYTLRFFSRLKELLALREQDFDSVGYAESIRENAEFRSANAWSLIFAIFIASIGLELNSTAVIIGAMLISPLMGSIIGAGYALATNDLILLKKSASNLGFAVVISIATSALFFLLSPAPMDQSELLGRTQPTFYDVLIAFFGGAAGIVAMSRKSKGNALPGVAIATALMPPLCTVGYGISIFNVKFIFGAFYLFTINTLFIFLSTYIFVYYLEYKPNFEKRVHLSVQAKRWLVTTVVIVVLPSFFMAWYLQKKTAFSQKANEFIDREIRPLAIVGTKNLSFGLNQSKIEVTIYGKNFDSKITESLKKKVLEDYKMQKTEFTIIEVDTDNLDIRDIESKFVTKADFMNLEKKLISRRESEMAQKLRFVASQYGNKLVSSIQWVNGQVQVDWNQSPSHAKKIEIENKIQKALDRAWIVHKRRGVEL